MKQFRVRLLIDMESIVSAEDAAAAIQKVSSAFDGYRFKVHGAQPADTPWPDYVDDPSAPRLPPRNTPPSGSPGTPTPQRPPVKTSVDAAAAQRKVA